MALYDYAPRRTGLPIVDPYNDLLSDGGKLWPKAKPVAEAVDLLTHLRALVEAARRAGVMVFYLPHRRWREGNYDGWRHPGPFQTLTDREAVFGESMWGGDWHPELVPQPGDVVIQEHWGQNGFANTDLDLQLKQRNIEKIIVVGMGANTCVEATARCGAELGYRVTLVRDATAAFSSEAKWWKVGALVTMAAGFAVLVLMTVKAYQNAPPIPDRFVNPAGTVVFAADDVIAGQEVFLKHGLMDNGTIWGHGGYLGPDFSAQSLHMLALDLADRIARERLSRGYADLTSEERAAVNGAVALDLKANRYDPASGTLVLPAGAAESFKGQVEYWTRYFGAPERNGGLA